MKIELEGKVCLESIEDGYQAAICELDEVKMSSDGDEDAGFFIRLQSWNEEAVSIRHKKTSAKPYGPEYQMEKRNQALAYHPTIRDLVGKSVRITIKVLD